MATPEQFRAWSERGPDCRFNDTTVSLPGWGIREYTSSLWLYSKEGCNVTQLIPAGRYNDFFIHHLSDKYVSQAGKPWPNVAVDTIGSMLRNLTNTTKSTAAGRSNGLITMIDDRVSS
jgi:hypothetical protein